MENENQNQTPNVPKRPGEKVIQPISAGNLTPTPPPAPPAAPSVDVSSIYPTVTAEIGTSGKIISPEQAFALNTNAENAREADRLVCMRIKSVLVIGVILLLASLLVIALSLGKPYGTIIVVISVVQLLMAVGLLTTKDHHTASLIIKVFLVFQILNEISNFANPAGLAISTVGLGLLVYAYFRVKGLSYY